jgi:prefoldin subunit 5
VEKIVEVIKEVEKPNDRMEMLQETLLTLRKELQTKNERIKELEKINRDLENLSSQKGAVFLRGSNLNNRL